MNEDDYWQDILYDYIHNRNFSWSQTTDYRSTEWIYDILKEEMEPDMAFTRYDRYTTRGDEVATMVLDAYADGIEFETLIMKNDKVRQYWYQVQSEKANRLKDIERNKERRRKAAEKRKIEEAKRVEAVSKLTDEEREAFGLNTKGYHKR